MRLPLQQGQLVALDTGIWRDLCYQERDWSEAFGEMRGAGFHFAFADHLLAEAIAQLERGDVTDQQFVSGMARAGRFISPAAPVLPGKRGLAESCGCVSPEEAGEFDSDSQDAYLAAVWSLLSSSGGLADLGAGHVYEYRGRQFQLRIDPGASDGALEAEREAWREHVMRFDALPDDALVPHRAEMLAHMNTSIDADLGHLDPPLSVRLDLAKRHMLAKMEQRNQSVGSYNPGSERNRNDGIDYNMAYVLMAPAFLVTLDRRYRNAVAATGSFQARWVLSPDEFVEQWREGTLPVLAWPE